MSLTTAWISESWVTPELARSLPATSNDFQWRFVPQDNGDVVCIHPEIPASVFHKNEDGTTTFKPVPESGDQKDMAAL